jgi:DNA-binding response OmpR family regulator
MPVIILGAKKEDADMFQGYELDANYYMAQPFTEEQLLFGLQMMFGQK